MEKDEKTYPFMKEMPLAEEPSLNNGDGTKENPFLISNKNDFFGIRNNLAAFYKLAGDLDFNGEQIETIGKANTLGAYFTGGLDGGGHTIRNFRISSDSQYTGLFGYVRNAVLKDLRIENAQVEQTRTSDTGVLAGYLYESTVENITFLDSSVSGLSNTGALAGQVYGGSVAGCSIRGNTTVNGTTYVGGLLGYVRNYATVRECSAEGTVTGQSQVGGLIGSFSWESVIQECCAEGTVTGAERVGGLVGEASGTIENSYAAGVVASTKLTQAGGLVGFTNSLQIRNSYAACRVSENGNGLIGIVWVNSVVKVTNAYYDGPLSGVLQKDGYNKGKLTVAMLKSSSYEDWDFEKVWDIEEGVSYPYLRSIGRLNETVVDRGAVKEGAGTQEAPYLVESREAFESIRYDLDGSYKLTVDIDFNGEQIETIGKSNTFVVLFTGGLDGGGHTIRNFRISSDSQYTGLFGYVRNAVLKDLRIENAQVEQTRTSDTGVLAGYLSNCTIENITFIDSSVSGLSNTGALAGQVYGGSVAGCSIRGNTTVNGTTYVGGLLGYIRNYVTVRECFAAGTVTGQSQVGGLIGSFSWESVIQECCAEGTVTGAERVGGLVGEASGTIENSYAAGVVASTKLTQAGGLVGFTNSLQIRNSYAACRVSENGNGLIGIVWVNSVVKVTNAYYDGPLSGALQKDGYNKGKLTVAMLKSSSYADWDFEKIWDIEEGVSYPYLRSIGRLNETVVDRGAVKEGAGTQEAPYLVESREAFESIRYDLDGSYKLTVDIDFNGEQIETIGKSNTFVVLFTGGLDGGGHTIRNFRISSDSQYTGLFGNVSNAVLKDLRIENAQVEQTRSSDTGVLAGYLSNCTIENITFIDSSVSGLSSTGALAGQVYGGSVAGCSIRGNTTVNGTTYVGGLLGYIRNYVTVRECFAAGTVTGQSQVGGLIGSFSWESVIQECCAEGTVTGAERVGGLVGEASGTIENSYAAGVVASTKLTQAGGLVGFTNSLQIRNSYAACRVSENGNGLIGIVWGSSGVKVTNAYYDGPLSGVLQKDGYNKGKLTVAMLKSSSYADWDFEKIWDIEEGVSYPYLRSIGRLNETVVDRGAVKEGAGTQEAPYLVESREAFESIRYDLDGSYKLMVDLDFNEEQIETIGKSNTFGAHFTGGLDGGGHAIRNFRISSDSQYTGVFGFVRDAILKNLRIENAQVEQTRTSDTGVLAGYLSNCTVENITFLDSSVSGVSNTGALAGQLYGGSVAGCSIRGNTTVNGITRVGGLLGYVWNLTTIRECSAAGTVTGQSQVGGLIGDASANITDCCTSCQVVSTANHVQTAGLAGNGSGGTIKNCFAAGSISENGSGLAYIRSATVMKVINSYFNSEAAGKTIPETQARTTQELMDKENYIDWDWDSIWIYKENTYPAIKRIEINNRESFALRFRDLTGFSVLLEWDEVPGAQEYTVSYLDKTFYSTVPQILLTDLLPDTSYEFRVQTEIAANIIVRSKVLKLRTKKFGITGVHCISKDDNSLLLTWEETEDAQSYEVLCNGNSQITSENTCTLSQLNKDIPYVICIRTLLKDGTVAESDSIVEKIYALDPKTEYAAEFIDKCQGQRWFMDEIEYLLNLKGKSINTIHSRRDFATIYAIGLAGRKISGTIPPAIGELRQLEYLYLGNNNLSGILPEELALLDQLKEMDLTGNQLADQ